MRECLRSIYDSRGVTWSEAQIVSLPPHLCVVQSQSGGFLRQVLTKTSAAPPLRRRVAADDRELGPDALFYVYLQPAHGTNHVDRDRFD
jgi:hypothetical protein